MSGKRGLYEEITEFCNSHAMTETCRVSPNLELLPFHHKVSGVTSPTTTAGGRFPPSMVQERSAACISETQSGAWWHQNEK